MEENSGAMKQEIAEALAKMRQERQKAGYARIGATVAVVLILVVFALRTYGKFTDFDVEALVAELQVEGAKRVWPMVASELDSLADEALPALKDAFAQESMNLGPRLQDALEQQSEVYIKNMSLRLASSLDQALKEHKMTTEAGVGEKFPSFKDNPEALEALNEQLARATREWATAQLDTTFEQHFQLLHSIHQTFVQMEQQVRDGFADGQEPRSVEEILTIFLEIVNMRLNPAPEGATK